MDLATLDKELEPVKTLQVEKLSKTARVALVPEEKTLQVFDLEKDKAWTADDGAYMQTLKHIGVSHGLMGKLEQTTAGVVATELLQRKGRATALIQDGNLLALAPKGRYKALPVALVLETLQDTLGEVECNRASILPNYDVRLEIVGQQEYEVVKGDLVRSGVLIEFNPVGLHDPMIQSYGLRLVCTNGATAFEVLETHVMTSEISETREWLTTTMTQAYEGLGGAVERWRQMAGFAIDPHDRPLLLSGLAKEAGLKPKERASLFARATEEPPETAYDVFNLMTWLTSHVMEHPQRVSKAQTAVARFVQDEVYTRHCPTCNRAG